MLKKLLLIGCPAFLLVSGCFGANIGLTVPAGPITAGDVFTVNVFAANYTDLFAFQFDLGYDPALLSVVSIDEGPFLPSGGATFFVPGAVDNITGTALGTADTLISLVPGVSGGGDLAVVQFRALGAGTALISLSNPLFLDSTFTAIGTAVAGGSIAINPGAATVPEPGAIVLLATGLGCLTYFRRRSPC